MDVFERLMQHHRIAEQRLTEIEKTTDKATERREQLFGNGAEIRILSAR